MNNNSHKQEQAANTIYTTKSTDPQKPRPSLITSPPKVDRNPANWKNKLVASTRGLIGFSRSWRRK